MINVVLASASPRRRELLNLIGIEHVVRPADIDESVREGESPIAYTERLSREKALAVASNLEGLIRSGSISAVSGRAINEEDVEADIDIDADINADINGSLIVAADTTVVIDGDILGKPADTDEAVAMISRLSGRTHTVVTGIACSLNGNTVSAVETVEVTFRVLTVEEIHDYVETREPMDKAGAYGIQGYGATIVERIEGDYFSVMGLPLSRLILLMKELGVHYRFNERLGSLI